MLQLEQERALLVEELAQTKAKLVEVEKQRDQLNRDHQNLSKQYETDTGTLKAQVESVRVPMGIWFCVPMGI